MPEAAEVKLNIDFIKPLILNQQLIDINIGKNSRYKNQLPENFTSFHQSLFQNIRVIDVDCKGKFIYWKFSNDYVMFNTFGMSGSYSKDQSIHTCAEFKFSNISIYFNDPRHFGTINFKNNYDLTKKLKGLGYSVLDENLSKNLPWLTNKIMSNNKTLAEILMNQAIFAGVGNYIKSEALYRAKLSPWRIGNSLNKDEVQLLAQSAVDVAQEAYKYQGATILTYKKADGEKGDYANFFQVYKKDKDPLGNIVKSETTLDKRTSHWVPAIQK